MDNKNALFRPVTITFETLDRLCKEDKSADLIALYMSYVAITQWQNTTSIKATTDFMSTRLKWDRHKLIATKKKLEQLGLIEAKTTKDRLGKVTGHYIRVMYVITSETQNGQIPQGGETHSVEMAHTSTINEQESADNLQSFAKKRVDLLSLVNKITGRNFRTLPERGVKKTLDAFSMAEIESALRALAADDWHRERLSEFKIDYLIRSTTIDKFLGKATPATGDAYGYKNGQKIFTEDEKGNKYWGGELITPENQDQVLKERMAD